MTAVLRRLAVWHSVHDQRWSISHPNLLKNVGVGRVWGVCLCVCTDRMWGYKGRKQCVDCQNWERGHHVLCLKATHPSEVKRKPLGSSTLTPDLPIWFCFHLHWSYMLIMKKHFFSILNRDNHSIHFTFICSLWNNESVLNSYASTVDHSRAR